MGNQVIENNVGVLRRERAQLIAQTDVREKIGPS